ncbi:MAG: hypothetical protein HQK96_02225 [Nitrospirae bacterium]|nr:hypothetical protein [Nitrospirota bacterium]
MDKEQIINDIIEINKMVCFDIWRLVDCLNKEHLEDSTPRLIKPKRREGTIRISEQESKALYCKILNEANFNYFYSVETPTEKTYKQKGEGERSGRSDISIYTHNGNEFNKVANMEFKFGNPECEDIRKDVEKLIREDILGNWFHTIDNINSETIKTLFNKFKKSFINHADDAKGKLAFVFCVCILGKINGEINGKKKAYTKVFRFDNNHDKLEEYVDSFFVLDYYWILM